MAAKTYSDAEVEQRLKDELPTWRLEEGWIRRTYKTQGWKGTLMVINTVGHLAEAAFHHPDITASYAWVEVRLMNHAAKGITDSDFALAKMIEQGIVDSGDSLEKGIGVMTEEKVEDFFTKMVTAGVVPRLAASCFVCLSVYSLL